MVVCEKHGNSGGIFATKRIDDIVQSGFGGQNLSAIHLIGLGIENETPNFKFWKFIGEFPELDEMISKSAMNIDFVTVEVYLNQILPVCSKCFHQSRV